MRGVFKERSWPSLLLAILAIWLVAGLLRWGWNSWLIAAAPQVPAMPDVAALGLAALLVLMVC